MLPNNIFLEMAAVFSPSFSHFFFFFQVSCSLGSSDLLCCDDTECLLPSKNSLLPSAAADSSRQQQQLSPMVARFGHRCRSEQVGWLVGKLAMASCVVWLPRANCAAAAAAEGGKAAARREIQILV